jgi:hypothetical protein
MLEAWKSSWLYKLFPAIAAHGTGVFYEWIRENRYANVTGDALLQPERIPKLSGIDNVDRFHNTTNTPLGAVGIRFLNDKTLYRDQN